MPNDPQKMVQTYVYLPTADLEELRQLARAYTVRPAQITRWAITHWLKHVRTPPVPE